MGLRLVRWIGDPSPFADPVLQKAIAFGQTPPALLAALEFFTTWQRQLLLPGTSARCFGVESGFSQTYCFGPRQYAAWMEEADAALVFANEWERWQFLDVTDDPSRVERPRMGKDDWRALLASFAKLGKGRRLRPEYRTGREAAGPLAYAAQRR